MSATTTTTPQVRVRPLPNLLVVGVKKAGTTSLFDYLGQHPQVCAGDVKAINWFKGSGADLADYAAHFAHWDGEPVRLESPTTYFYGGRAMATRIDQTLPDARFVVSLRDPVERFWSNYQMRQREDPDRVGRLDPTTFVERCRAAHASGDVSAHPGFSDFARGCYADMATEWFDVVGDRLRVVFVEQWTQDPAALVRDLCAWTGIDPAPADDIQYAVRNRTHDYRSRHLARLARRAYKGLRRRAPAVAGVKPAMVRLHHALNRQPNRQSMPSDVRRALEDAYREPNARLRSLLVERGRSSLPTWLVAA